MKKELIFEESPSGFRGVVTLTVPFGLFSFYDVLTVAEMIVKKVIPFLITRNQFSVKSGEPLK
jgi:hypothetical protein